MGTKFSTETEANVRHFAVIAQNEATWTLFVRSGQADHTNEALLRRAQADLERRSTLGEEEAPGSRKRRLKGAERIAGYLAEVAQHF
jgi:hypothetical protein